jgi:Lon protease-like protein
MRSWAANLVPASYGGQVVETLPIFPLATVLLPGALLPLHIFEARYRQLTTDLVTGEVPGRAFGVVAIRPGWSTNDVEAAGLHEYGCAAVLRQVRRLPDGRFDIVTGGERRFRILDIDASTAPYLIASIDWVPDAEPPDAAELSLLVRAAREAHRHYCGTAWRREDWHEPPPDADPRILAHLLAADCLLALEDRQHLLEETRPAHRLRLIRQMLWREAEFLRTLRAVPVPFTQFAAEPSRN